MLDRLARWLRRKKGPTPAERAAARETMDRITGALIELWGRDPSLQIGVPYRRMARDAATAAMVVLASEPE